jgi:hypothetical protein
MRRQSLRAPAHPPAAPASPVVTSARAPWSRQEGWRRRSCNHLNRPMRVMRVGEPYDAPRKTEAI